MLSVLAKIANTLEADGHFEMADQIDDVISAIAAREPFENEGKGEIWDQEQGLNQGWGHEDNYYSTEPDISEEMQADGLTERTKEQVGLGHSSENTYSSVVDDTSATLKTWMARLPEVKMYKDNPSPGSLRGIVDSLTDQLEELLDHFSESSGRNIKWDKEFPEAAKNLALDVLANRLPRQ